MIKHSDETDVAELLTRAINHHKAEVKRLSATLETFSGHLSNGAAKTGRYKKRGPYNIKASKKGRPKLKKLKAKPGSRHWKKDLKSLFKNNGNQPMSCSDLVAVMFDGKRKATKRVMKSRLANVLLNYEKDNTVVADRSTSPVTYYLKG